MFKSAGLFGSKFWEELDKFLTMLWRTLIHKFNNGSCSLQFFTFFLFLTTHDVMNRIPKKHKMLHRQQVVLDCTKKIGVKSQSNKWWIIYIFIIVVLLVILAQDEELIPFECYNQRGFDHLRVVFQQRWGVVDQEEFLLCLGFFTWRFRWCQKLPLPR